VSGAQDDRRDDVARTVPDWRVRGRGWVGALVLCVLLAAGGLPVPYGAERDGAHIEQCERVHAQRVVAIAGSRAPEHAVRCSFVEGAPRAVPRARSIADGGLPGPRAPTA
jgi:hypothetical protein